MSATWPTWSRTAWTASSSRPGTTEALTDALRALLLDRDKREIMGQRARDRAEAYGKRQMLAQLRVVFDECWESR